MPITPTYPGVYIEELPSGVRTITGVATSITAFIGRALKGPVDEPITINNFGDFERRFGGLWVESTMSYAVNDFFLNGGSKAIIVRIFREDETASPSTDATATITLPANSDNLILVASSQGSWGANLKVLVNHDTREDDNGNSDPNLFNLTIIEDVENGSFENFLNVSVNSEDPRYLPRVLEHSSLLVRVQKDPNSDEWIVPSVPPDETVIITSPMTSPSTEADKPIVAIGGSDGIAPEADNFKGSPDTKKGIFALEKTDLFNLLCIPPAERNGNTAIDVYQKAMSYCYKKRAMLIVDSTFEWGLLPETAASNAIDGLGGLGLTGKVARNAVIYFPRVRKVDPLRDGQIDTFVPCGIIAGVMARTDTERGVWKAPAGLDAALNGIQGLQVNLNNAENGDLNKLGINCLRSFPVTGRVVWGARTLRGADRSADEYKYVPVRRTALFIEESLYRGTQWVVFEPNDEPLWAQIRLNVGAFMHDLFRQGAFQGKSPKEAYLVKCDKETTTQNDIDKGIVNILVGFAPLKPAEFVIIKIQQLAGQLEV